MKPSSTTRRDAALALTVSVQLLSACAAQVQPSADGDARPSDSVSSVLDRTALEAAVKNQHTMEEGGFSLAGRAWASPDSQLSFYVGPEGQQVILSSVGPQGLLSGLEFAALADGEEFEDYVQRVDLDGPLPVRGMESDVLLFDVSPAEAAGELGRTTAAVTVEELALLESIMKACQSRASAFCGQPYGWDGSHIEVNKTSWNGSPINVGGNGSAFLAAACAHGDGASIDIDHVHPSFGEIPAEFHLDVAPLSSFAAFGHGWIKQDRECVDRRFFVCTWKNRLQFSHFDTTFNMHSINPASRMVYACAMMNSRYKFLTDNTIDIELGLNVPRLYVPRF